MQRTTLNGRFLLLQMTQMLIVCIGVSYLSPVLYTYGYGELTIGTILAMAALCATGLRPLLGYLNDRFACTKEILIALNSTGFCCFFLLCRTQNLILLWIAVVGANASLISAMNFVDSWIIRLIDDGSTLNYGLTRAGGSLAYAVGALVFGSVNEQFGFCPGSWVLLVLLGIMLLLSHTIPNPKHDKNMEEKKESLLEAIQYLCKNRKFTMMLGAYFLLTITTCAVDSFQSVQILYFGGSKLDVGTALFIQSVSETAVMIGYSKIKMKLRKPAAFLMAIGMMGFGVRALMISLAQNVQQIVLAGTLQAASFSLVAPSVIEFILETVKSSYLSTSHLFFQAIGNGVAMIMCNLLCGILAERCGTAGMFRIVCMCAFAASLLAFGVIHMKKTEPDVHKEDG